MFEYAISRNQRQRPTNRILAACVASSVVHIILLLTIIQFPQLLQGGMLSRFRVISMITNSLTQKTNDQENDWRTVAVLRPQSKMQAPSAEQLKKLVYDWSKKGTGNRSTPNPHSVGERTEGCVEGQCAPGSKNQAGIQNARPIAAG